MLGSQMKLIVVINVTKNHSQCHNNFKFDDLSKKEEKMSINSYS